MQGKRSAVRKLFLLLWTGKWSCQLPRASRVTDDVGWFGAMEMRADCRASLRYVGVNDIPRIVLQFFECRTGELWSLSLIRDMGSLVFSHPLFYTPLLCRDELRHGTRLCPFEMSRIEISNLLRLRICLVCDLDFDNTAVGSGRERRWKYKYQFYSHKLSTWSPWLWAYWILIPLSGRLRNIV